MSTTTFSGLSMPVFTAFGWAGEEAAIEFALSQLELFIDSLYFALPRDVQSVFAGHGLDRVNQTAYLATSDEPASGLLVSFLARPMSLEVNLSIHDKKALAQSYNFCEAQPAVLLDLLAGLGAGWNLRLQQMEYDEESGQATHYQDIFKDGVETLDQDAVIDFVARASFLNGESKWIVPIALSKRFDSEKVAAMGTTVRSVIRDEIKELTPVIRFLTGQAKKKRAPARSKKTPAKPKKPSQEETTPKELIDAAALDQFTYISELKALHIRRGFINLTPSHWPFFAINARSETRAVTLNYDDKSDDQSMVWRLVPNDQARLNLSVLPHRWLEENFHPNDQIELTATRKGDDNIVITLKPLS